MSCRRDRCDQVEGRRSFPCREELRRLERCLRSIEESEAEAESRRCRCCCCCCRRNDVAGNQTTWGR